ncbi:hypothetical protein J6590_021022 [Homalodisca vitripennis]|nr:hypothetical protein J6590_021022 [Homalodisca vitripennis]
MEWRRRSDRSTSIEGSLTTQAYGDDALSRKRVFEWYKMFKESRELLEHDHHIRRPITARTDAQVAKV